MNAEIEDEEIENEEMQGDTEGDMDFGTNGWDAHISNCSLVDNELARIHRIVHEFQETSPVRKTQLKMLDKFQARVLELTAQS